MIVTFNEWEKDTNLVHAFSTRHGGVSTGHFGTMNLGLNRGDERDRVLQNYKIMADILGVEFDSFTASSQTHTCNIKYIAESYKGNGVSKSNEFKDVDGIYTNKPNITLVTYYADCVPLFFYAPKYNMIGMSHAGWRGTVLEIGKHMATTFNNKFNIPFNEIEVGIGPAICKNCFEVHKDVADEFLSHADFKQFVSKNPIEGKFNVDLWACNKYSLEQVGVEKIYLSNTCTCCNTDKFYSHRKEGAQRGSLAGFIGLRR
ncbi:MAG: hypothetical protein BEN19_07920 [Epulopiscium sp. Nuni2H_MBin003]|nr:MAG: hypothetical protein BEN19_07920 [Epulopiscium sp. Nuni2H_MBin003]